MVRVLVNESDSLQCMITLKRKFISVPPLGCKIKRSRMKECFGSMLLQISLLGYTFTCSRKI